MLLSVFKFGDVLLVFETRGLVGKKTKPDEPAYPFPSKVSDDFYTTEGRISTKQNRFYPKSGGRPERIRFDGPRVTPGGPFGSFINTLRGGDFSKCNVGILDAHRSSALCHLGNISFRLGQAAPFGEKIPQFSETKQATDSFDTIRENLEAAGIGLADATCQVGPVLDFDPETEKFVGNDAANALLTRRYREPFVVPEKV
jgi:hypothetical protein